MGNTGLKIIPHYKSPLAEITPPPPHGRISDGDAQLLLYLSRMADGPIVEIGCHRGQTTLMLAKYNPGKMVFGIDYSGSPTMHQAQSEEWLSAEDIGSAARQEENVRLFNMVSWQFTFPEKTGLVFVDGDHSTLGIVSDFANILQYVKAGFVVFHDYYPDAPEWCAVNDFIGGFLARRFRVFHIENTNCAWIEL